MKKTLLLAFILLATLMVHADYQSSGGGGDVVCSGCVGTADVADNSITGAKIALGSDAQGDVMYYNGTDWARLGAGTAGRPLITNGAGQNPSFSAIAPSVITFSGARAFATADQSLADNTVTAIIFDDTDSYDAGGYHDPASNNTRMTAVTTGYHQVRCNVNFAANATGRRVLLLQVDGTGATVSDGEIPTASASNNTVMQVAATIHLTAAQYVECKAYQTSGGALNSVRSASRLPWFEMTYLGS